MVRLWDVATGRLRADLKGQEGLRRVQAVAFSPDGKWLASGSDDGTIKFWEPQTATELLTLVHLRGGDWLVFTPDSRVDAPLGGFRYISWWMGDRVYGFAQLKDRLYVPKLWSMVRDAQRLPNQ